VQDFSCAGLATATASRHAEAIFQVLKFGRTERRRLADFAFGNRVTDTNIHIRDKVVAMRIILIYISTRVKRNLDFLKFAGHHVYQALEK
jgi:hypothetical protein